MKLEVFAPSSLATAFASVSPHIAKNKSNITDLFFMIINKYVNINEVRKCPDEEENVLKV